MNKRALPLQLRIYGFLPLSHSNGPGCRSVVWVQGCSLGCPGCFNPESHAFREGQSIVIEELLSQITAQQSGIEGVTISGGEPLQQGTAVTALLRELKTQTDLSVLLFTGFTWGELHRMDEGDPHRVRNTRYPAPGEERSLPPANGKPACQPPEFLRYVDVLLAGRFQRNLRVARGLLGSANKEIHFLTNRYGPEDLEPVPEAELVLAASGEVMSSGIDPFLWEEG